MGKKKTRRRWGRVRKLPSGRWQARYPGPDGSLYPADDTFPTKTDAELWLTDKEAEIRRTGWRDPNAGKVPLANYAENWVAERKVRPRTRALYEGLLRRHILPELGHVELSSITPQVVRAWHSRRLKAVGEVTVAKAYRLLKAILATAADEDEVILRNPCRIKGAGQERSSERVVPTIGQVYAIAGAIKPWWRAMVLTAAFTGLRISELRGLERRDIDLNERLLHVRRSVIENGAALEEGPPKSRASERTVAIPDALVPELERQMKAEWLDRGHPNAVGWLKLPSARRPVFVGPRGGPPRSGNFAQDWREACEQVAVVGVTFHALRHVANEIVGDVARNLKEQMAWMGHSSTRAALIYQHTGPNRYIADAISEQMRQAAKGHAGGTDPDSDAGLRRAG